MIYGTGTDLCDIQRIERLHRRYGERFEQRILPHAQERRTHPSAAFLAGRFALKEAAAKALGFGIGARLSFADMCICAEGAPRITLSLNAQKNWPNVRLHGSISHDGSYAIAFCVAEQTRES